MWKDYYKGVLNSDNSANEFAEFVEHSIDCKENFLGTEMPMYFVVSLTSLVQKLPLNKAPGPDFVSAEHMLHAGESLCFSLIYCFICVLFSASYPIPAGTQLYFPYAKTKTVVSHMQKHKWEFD